MIQVSLIKATCEELTQQRGSELCCSLHPEHFKLPASILSVTTGRSCRNLSQVWFLRCVLVEGWSFLSPHEMFPDISSKVKDVLIKLFHRFWPCHEVLTRCVWFMFCRDQVQFLYWWTQMSREVLVTITEALVWCLSVWSNNKETNDVIKFLYLLDK